jgi:hypothetical protein
MDTIDKLIKSLEEAKAELTKNLNAAPGAEPAPNMKKEEVAKDDIVKPDKGYGKITIKNPAPKPPTDPTKPYGKVIMKEEEMEKDAANPALAPKEVKVKKLQAQIDAGTYKPDPKKIADKMLKEELTCSENGQWNLKTN